MNIIVRGHEPITRGARFVSCFNLPKTLDLSAMPTGQKMVSEAISPSSPPVTSRCLPNLWQALALRARKQTEDYTILVSHLIAWFPISRGNAFFRCTLTCICYQQGGFLEDLQISGEIRYSIGLGID